MPWPIPPWFFHKLKWECSGQLARLAACAVSQGEFCAWSQLGSDHSCLPALAIAQRQQGFSSDFLRSAPTQQTCLLLAKRVI